MFKWIKRGVSTLFGLIIIGSIAAYIWFWGRPVGINNYINKQMMQFAMETPELLTQLGVIDNTPLDFHSGKLADYTKEFGDKQLERVKESREGMDRFDLENMDEQDRLSYDITAWFFDDMIRQSEFEHSGYPISQLTGPTVNMPSFLTDIHAIKNEKSLKRYISRIEEFGRVLDEMHWHVEDHAKNGVIAPDFIIEGALKGMRSFIEDGADKNPLVTTLPAKLEKLELSEEKEKTYTREVRDVVRAYVIPGYEKMIALHEELLTQTNHDAGIWRIPDGDKIYANALKSNTTTDFTADEVHNIGLSEVARIEAEMDEILIGEELKEGTVTERIQQLMSDPDQQFANTDEGRQDMITYLEALDQKILENAGDYFITLPPQALEIVRVPEYSQDGAPGGYYNPPALDGSRPGRFYINQKNTADNPKWTLPTLMVHEGSPGHHFQIALQMNLKGVPLTRKFPLFTAYSEGWALYAERVAKEDMGIYDNDPLGDLGRLQAEMFRAVRLVVDTGMHSKRWSREKAIDYMLSKTGMTEAEVTREIERYVVWPGQATAYKTGQLAILKIRENAEAALGDKFDIREFHEALLTNGAMPLSTLEAFMNNWVEAQKAK